MSEEGSGFEPKSNEPRSFETQFADWQTIEFPDHKVGVIDITPETLNDLTPVLLVPGWSERPSAYKKALGVLHREKRRVITLDFDR